MYWWTKTNGAFAVHLASTSCCGAPSFVGTSRYSGGFFGLGDHAAAEASWARAKNARLAESAGVFTASTAFASAGLGGPPIGARQHGLMMYRLPKTSECFIPIRAAP